MPWAEPHKRARRHPKNKKAYQVRNWPAYDRALQNRGDVTLWISEEAIAAGVRGCNRLVRSLR